ncbi:MAG: SDR family oxidoreductase [Candidatus Omnitrophota bacterium]|nr:SDR family oxidoreductase [Candidatus Omnitrophota bacterium]
MVRSQHGDRRYELSEYISGLFGLEGKTAAVIGAGGYLCSEMSKAFSKAGARVAVIDKNLENAKKVSEAIRAFGGDSIALDIDVTQKGSHEKALETVLKKFKTIDILVNGAGINAPTKFFEISLQEWEGIIAVCLTGTMLGCQVFGGQMVKENKGSIINVSSASAGPPLSKAFTYSVAKSGVKNLTQNLAREWAPYNVRVNALCPGFFPTEWSKNNFIDVHREKAILEHTPMKRYGRPEELVGAVLWLSSESASFVTGAEIKVDGGFSCMTI